MQAPLGAVELCSVLKVGVDGGNEAAAQPLSWGCCTAEASS